MITQAAGERSAADADRATRNASIMLGLALPTDTVLYLLLPLYPEAFGVTLAEAGLLLAANRLVRIAGYGWVARAYQRRGPRAVCAVAAIGAVAASLGYALLPGDVAWLLPARLAWGLSFAAMNIAVQALPTAVSDGMARRSGRSRAIIAAGPMLGLIAGAAMAGAIGPRAVFAVLAAVALLALAFALRLPTGRGQAVRGAPRFGRPTRVDVWSFVQGMTLDGLFILGLAVLARDSIPSDAAMAAGAALALRYVAEVVLGPPGGALAERFGAARLLVLLSCASAVGLAAIGFGALWSGALAVVLLRGLIQPLAAPVVAAANPGAERVPALARLATWRDLGAGLGPLVAGVLLPLMPAAALYGAAATLLAASALALAITAASRST
ncbi:MAG: MFS transporter [Proteobacteria bacterium]|nr:MFS transporter [Pseudomonadota bacterium]